MKFKQSNCCATLLTVFTALFLAAQPASALRITEVMYHPLEQGGTAEGDEILEFIELHNDKAVFEDLSSFAFTNGVTFTFGPDTILAAGAYIVVARDPDAVEAAYGISGVFGPFSGRLDNDGERIELSNSNGGVVLSFAYNDNRPWPRSPDGTGHSLVLADPAGDPEEGSTWAPSIYIGGSPGRADSAKNVDPTDPVLVNLVKLGDAGRYFKGLEEPSPSGNTPTTAWTQINFNDEPAATDWISGDTGYGYSNEQSERQYLRTLVSDMQGNYVSIYARVPFTLTAQQIASFTELRAVVHYDDAYVLYLNGDRVATSGNIVGIPPAFDQTASSGSDFPAANHDLTGSMHLLVPGKNVLAIQGHNSNKNTSSDGFISPILDAVLVETGPTDDPEARLLINELLPNSNAAPGTDWVELYNPGPVSVNLGNVYLSDNRFDLLKYKLPDGIILSPGQFWAVREGVAPAGFPFGLEFSGETVYLTVGTGSPAEPVRLLDALRYGASSPDVTVGRFPDGSENVVTLSSPTFAAANAQPLTGDIVINEIMYHHGLRNENYEYVELYNKGASTISLLGWAFTDGITYDFNVPTSMAPGSYLVIARNPDTLASVYSNLVVGSNLIGPYSGNLDDHSERVQLSYPMVDVNDSGQLETFMVTADEVTYYDGGRWPQWADGQGSSMELRDPHSNNNAPDAWADSDESDKSAWQQFSYIISAGDSQYSHDSVSIFSIMLLNRGEVLLDDVECIINGSDRVTNGDFEGGTSPWRFLGNHVRTSVTTQARHSGSRGLHLIATGHGDPGANRVNQSISSVTAGTVTFRGWVRWLKGTQYMLLRTTRERAPTQPPRPAHAFTLNMPRNLGTPGLVNTAYTSNRGPDISNVRHEPITPTSGQPILVTAQVTDDNGVGGVTLRYRNEGATSFSSLAMVDTGTGYDEIAADGIFTARIPGTSGGQMRAFYIDASDGSASTRFPTTLQSAAQAPDRTCLVRIGDSAINTRFAKYRIWLSNDVIDAFTSRPNLSNELMDCTFVYDDIKVFYNAKVRFRGSPFLRSGFGRDPRGRYAYRLDFNPDDKFGAREEINLDNTEDGGRGPLQERASYWMYKQIGLQFSRQEYVRLIVNGSSETSSRVYDDVQKVDGDYVDAWFPDDDDGYIHKIDDYFEYDAGGTSHSNLDEGLKYDSSHPLLKETYRWGFEKRSHRENDTWNHLFDFAVAINTPSSSPAYETIIESVMDPRHFARSLAVRHAVGDWDSYGFNRGKNNMFYFGPSEHKWYLIPWDIDFTMGSGRGPTEDLFSINAGQFPEVAQFLAHPKYRLMYLQAFEELVNSGWRTSYGTSDPPTPFDKYVNDAAAQLIADGSGDGRRDDIKRYVRDRRNYILTQVTSAEFVITTNGGQDLCTSATTVKIRGIAPAGVQRISVNGTDPNAQFSGLNSFEFDYPTTLGSNHLALQGLDRFGTPVPGATDSITITAVPPSSITSVTPEVVMNTGTTPLTISGSGFEPGSATEVVLTVNSDEIGFDALYVESNSEFDRIDAATLLLDVPSGGVGDYVNAVHNHINLGAGRFDGVFPIGDSAFAVPFNTGGHIMAIRFSGYIMAPSSGIRYFGVHCGDGFTLWIGDEIVGQYADIRAPATSDVTRGRTSGTMTFDFPAPGLYYIVLDYFANAESEQIEFFQTDASGNNRKLINVDAELIVFRDNATRIDATNVVVTSANTITCNVTPNGAEPGMWGMTVIPECGVDAGSTKADAVRIAVALSDINSDGRVDFGDLAYLTDRWGLLCSTPGVCGAADIDNSGDIGLGDAAIIAQQWLTGTE